jgi:asparagine synthase (glutamine-hydrolysing)
MLYTNTNLFLGRPTFAGTHAQALADKGDFAQAWTATLDGTGDVAAELAGVTGHFAVGLVQPSGRIVLAVDRFAVHSLCYRVAEGKLLFAARADAVAQTPPRIDPQGIFDYLYFHVIVSPRTIYQEVFRLPPGHYAVFENDRLHVAPYWHADLEEPKRVADFDALKTEFRSVVRQAVQGELTGGRPACFLSGGTDSSTVAGMASEVAGTTVHTYSIGFDAQGYDEMAFARIAAQHFKTEHHEYYVTPDDLVQNIPKVAAHFDQPFGNSSALPAYCCARMAREDGVTKLLAGDGGDELFGGNVRYAKQRVFGWYQQVPSTLRTGVLEPVLAMRATGSVPLVRKAASYVEQARVPIPDRLQMYNLIMRLGPADVLTPAVMARIDVTLPLQLQRDVWRRPSTCSDLNRELAFDWRFTLAESDLPKVVGATNLAGIDVGFPMLDHQLLAFSLKLPTAHKLKGLKLRWFFKEALRDFLPAEIITKKKQGFGLPFGVWTRSTPALLALAKDSLHGLVDRKIVRGDFVQSLFSERLPEHPGYYGEMIWILMMLEQWLRAKAPSYRMDD